MREGGGLCKLGSVSGEKNLERERNHRICAFIELRIEYFPFLPL